MRPSMHVDFAAEFLVEDHFEVIVVFSGLLIGAEDESQVKVENYLQFPLAWLLTRSHQCGCYFSLLPEAHSTWNLNIFDC